MVTKACCHKYRSFYLFVVTADTHSAAASVATRISRAFVDLTLTACARVTRQTGASVASLASVGTGGSIKAGLMVCTVVQIWNVRKGATLRNILQFGCKTKRGLTDTTK